MLSGPHKKFAEGIAKGMNKTRAYLDAYPDAKADSASVGATRLLKNDKVLSEIARIRQEADKIAGSAVLTLAEKRDFCARLVRAKVGELPASSDLWSSIKKTEFGHEFKLPDKLAAIKLDNDLAGEGSEAGANAALSGLLGRVRK